LQSGSLFCPNLGGAARQSIADASDGLSKTVVLAVNENGKSICGGYLEPAWRVGAWAEDNSKSFLFMLKNHAGVGPTKFPMNGSNSYAAYMKRGHDWRFGNWEGPYVYRHGNPGTWSGGARRSSTAGKTSSEWRAGSSGRSREGALHSGSLYCPQQR
jgi:hypothetical protein